MKEPLSSEAKAVLDAVTFSRYDVPSEACPGSIEQIKADAAQVLFAAARQILEASPEWLGVKVPYGFSKDYVSLPLN